MIKHKGSLSASCQQGFTLLELMVVLVIIGSLLGMVTVAYQVDDDDEALQQTGHSLRVFLQHQIGRSWLDGETLGAKVTAQEVTMTRLDLETETWVDSELTWSLEDDQVEINLVLKDTQDESQIEMNDLVKRVDIAFVASGEYTPFEIRISLIEQESATPNKHYLLMGDGVNALELSEK